VPHYPPWRLRQSCVQVACEKQLLFECGAERREAEELERQPQPRTAERRAEFHGEVRCGVHPRGGRRQGSRRCTDAPPQAAARRARSERPNRMVGTGPCAGPSRPSASVRSQQGHGARALSGRRRLRTPRRRAATRRARRRASFSRSTIESRRADDSCSPATPLTNSLMSALENHQVSTRTQRSCAGSPGRRRCWRPAVRRRAGVRGSARAGRRERRP
jgi:hypothetical protein